MVVTVGTVVVVMMTTIVALAMRIGTAALMVAATTTDHVILIVMLQVAVMTVIAAAVMIAVVAAIMPVTVDVPVTEAMATWPLPEMLAIRTEVELSMTAQTIGTLVVELRLANLFRCGALCQIKAPTPASIARIQPEPLLRQLVVAVSPLGRDSQHHYSLSLRSCSTRYFFIFSKASP